MASTFDTNPLVVAAQLASCADRLDAIASRPEAPLSSTAKVVAVAYEGRPLDAIVELEWVLADPQPPAHYLNAVLDSLAVVDLEVAEWARDSKAAGARLVPAEALRVGVLLLRTHYDGDLTALGGYAKYLAEEMGVSWDLDAGRLGDMALADSGGLTEAGNELMEQVSAVPDHAPDRELLEAAAKGLRVVGAYIAQGFRAEGHQFMYDAFRPARLLGERGDVRGSVEWGLARALQTGAAIDLAGPLSALSFHYSAKARNLAAASAWSSANEAPAAQNTVGLPRGPQASTPTAARTQ